MPGVQDAAVVSAPLSNQQLRLWLLDQARGESREYTLVTATNLVGLLNMQALMLSLNAVVARHESLRTTFSPVQGVPQQFVASHCTLTLRSEDLSDLPPEARSAGVNDILRRELDEPFALSEAPPIRFVLAKTSPTSHVLVRSVHHIVWDGWSRGLFEREFRTLYDAYADGVEPALAPLHYQYRDFAAEQRASAREERNLTFWKPRLLRIAGLTERPRAVSESVDAHWRMTSLDVLLTQKLRRSSEATKVSLYSFLMSTLALQLGQHFRREEIVVGVPFANRSSMRLEKVIGFVATALPVTVSTGGSVLAEQVHRTQDELLDVLDHSHDNLDRLLREVTPVTRPRDPRFFDALLSMPHASWDPARMRHLDVEPLSVPQCRGHFALELNVRLRHDTCRLSWLARKDAFDEFAFLALVRGFTESLWEMVEQFERTVTLPVGATPTHVGSRDATERFQSVAELVFEQARRRPRDMAVIGGHLSYTYADVASRVAHFTSRLSRAGIGPAMVVAVALPRNPDLVVAVLALLRMGAIYFPVDPDEPTSRLHAMLEDANASYVLTSNASVQRWPTTVRPLQLDDATAGDDDTTSVSGFTGPADAAYLMYTSGSSGKPKGVVVEHGALKACMSGIAGRIDFAGHVQLATTPVTFDISILELIFPLCHGGTVVVANATEARDPSEIARLIRDLSVSSIQATPSVWRLFVRHPALNLATVRVLCGGEALSKELAAQLAERSPELWNLYGPTETTIWTSVHRVGPADLSPDAPSVVSIGTPLNGCSVEVLGRDLEPMLAGHEGELFIGGAALARGYLNVPQLTAERFVTPLPRCARLYRTGDLGIRGADGNVHFLGRADRQVKIHGVRVEPAEIESVIRRQEGIADVALVSRPSAVAGVRLDAYVVLLPNAHLQMPDLRRRVASELPDVMVPSTWTQMMSLPVTAHGKLDHRALPEPAVDSHANRSGPKTADEATLCSIFASVFGRTDIEIGDNFFQLGGHSLLAIDVINRIHVETGVDVSLRTIFDSSTVSELAAHVTRARASSRGCS